MSVTAARMAPDARRGRRARKARTGRTVAYYVISTVLAAIFLFPVVWTAWSSIHGTQATGTADNGVGFDNYHRLFKYGEGFGRYFANSVIVSALTVAGTLAISLLGGYAFAYLPFRGRGVLFMAALAILMVPYTTLLIPLYILLQWLSLQNTLVGLSLVLIMLQLPFGLFMMRNSFEALPAELEDAALVDGCSAWKVMTRVLLPGVIPGLVTVALFAFLASWNEFVAPLIFLSDGTKFTLPVALVNLRSGTFGSVDFGALEAGIAASAAPCVLLFLFLQRYYVTGFSAGAIKA
jgi:multiple sugar transport system permease protein